MDESDTPKHFKAEDIVKSVPPIARGEFHIVPNDDKDNFNTKKVKKKKVGERKMCKKF